MHFVAGRKAWEGQVPPCPTIVMPLQYTNLLISACVAVGIPGSMYNNYRPDSVMVIGHITCKCLLCKHIWNHFLYMDADSWVYTCINALGALGKQQNTYIPVNNYEGRKLCTIVVLYGCTCTFCLPNTYFGYTNTFLVFGSVSGRTIWFG